MKTEHEIDFPHNVCMHVSVCMYVCMYVCVYVYVCIYVCMYVCMYIYVYSAAAVYRPPIQRHSRLPPQTNTIQFNICPHSTQCYRVTVR